MKEKESKKEPNLREKILGLWETLEETEDLYLKDFPTASPLVFSFGKIQVSINFACYDENCRDYGIGACSISYQQKDYSEFRKDIVIRKTKNGLESTIKEYDLDAFSNHLPGDKNYPFIMPALSQPIAYYEEVLNHAKKPSALYRKLNHKDIDEAIDYLDKISGLLTYIST